MNYKKLCELEEDLNLFKGLYMSYSVHDFDTFFGMAEKLEKTGTMARLLDMYYTLENILETENDDDYEDEREPVCEKNCEKGCEKDKKFYYNNDPKYYISKLIENLEREQEQSINKNSVLF